MHIQVLKSGQIKHFELKGCNMKRKIVIALMLSVMALVTVTGCSFNAGNDTETETEDTGRNDDESEDEDEDEESEDKDSEDEKSEDEKESDSEESEKPEKPEESEKPEKPLQVGYEVGEQVPDFEFYDAKGNRHTISEFRGKAVYINFFTTWCTYCFYELPDMEDVYDKYSDDVEFIMIDLAEGPELGLQYADDYDVTIPIYYVDDWEIDGLSIDAVPLSIVIDGNGVVYGNQLGQASYDWMDDTVNDAIESTK